MATGNVIQIGIELLNLKDLVELSKSLSMISAKTTELTGNLNTLNQAYAKTTPQIRDAEKFSKELAKVQAKAIPAVSTPKAAEYAKLEQGLVGGAFKPAGIYGEYKTLGKDLETLGVIQESVTAKQKHLNSVIDTAKEKFDKVSGTTKESRVELQKLYNGTVDFAKVSQLSDAEQIASWQTLKKKSQAFAENNTLLDKSGNALKYREKQLRVVQSLENNGVVITGKAKQAMSDTTTAMGKNALVMDQTNWSMATLGDKIKGMTQRIIPWAIGWTAIYGAMRMVTSFIMQTATTALVAFGTNLSRVLTATEGVSKATDTNAKVMRTAYGAIAQFAATGLANVAEIMYQIGSAGLGIKEQLSGTLPIINLTVGTFANAGETAKLVTGIYRLYGDQLDKNSSVSEKFRKITDILAYNFRVHKIELQDISAAYNYVGASAGLVEVSFEDLTSTIGFLNDNMYQGSKAGMSLFQAFGTIASKASEITDKLGLTFDITQPLNFIKVMDKLHSKYGNQKLSLEELGELNKIFGERAGKGIEIIIAKYDEWKKGIDDSKNKIDGSAESMAKLVENTAAVQWDKFAKGIGLAFKELEPMLVWTLKAINAIVVPTEAETLSKMLTTNRDLVDKIAKSYNSIAVKSDDINERLTYWIKQNKNIGQVTNEEIMAVWDLMPKILDNSNVKLDKFALANLRLTHDTDGRLQLMYKVGKQEVNITDQINGMAAAQAKLNQKAPEYSKEWGRTTLALKDSLQYDLTKLGLQSKLSTAQLTYNKALIDFQRTSFDLNEKEIIITGKGQNQTKTTVDLHKAIRTLLAEQIDLKGKDNRDAYARLEALKQDVIKSEQKRDTLAQLKPLLEAINQFQIEIKNNTLVEIPELEKKSKLLKEQYDFIYNNRSEVFTTSKEYDNQVELLKTHLSTWKLIADSNSQNYDTFKDEETVINALTTGN